MLYGVEINEPYQVQAEVKMRCMLGVSEDEAHTMTWAAHDRPHRIFCTPDKEGAERLAGLLAESWGAQAVPVEEGVEFSADDMPAVIAAFEARRRTATKQARQIR